MITTNIIIVLGLTLRKFVVWVTCDVCMMIIKKLCALAFVLGQMALSPFTSSFACKLCHSPPLCVVDYLGRIYYVVHRLPSIIRATIHLGVHKHPMADGKCREFVDETRRLIVKEVNHMLDAKGFAIFFGVSKTFLAMHLLDDSGNGTMELLNDEHLEQI